MSARDGGPAFPVWELNGDGRPEMTCFGMTLRDYFAAKAMQGLCASGDYDTGSTSGQSAIALNAYDIADAMMVIGAGNARLMAAAPELLEACQTAAVYLDPARFHDAIRVIEAAIAKATGGAA